MLIFRRIHCVHVAYGTVTLYDSAQHSTDRPPRTLVESDSNTCCMYTVCPPEDMHLRLETCRGTQSFMNK